MRANPQAFDATALAYDEGFSNQQLGRWLREAVHAELGKVFGPGDHILELGCGTGEDALFLARRGIQVTATDASREMLAVAQAKCQDAGATDRVRFQMWDFSIPGSLGAAIQRQEPVPAFDGVFSNFGGLNCIPERQSLAAALHPWLRPGGKLVLVLMGPLCPWEIAWHLTHGQGRTAFRRFRSGASAHAGAGQHIQTWFPSPAKVRRELKGYYRLHKSAGIGFFLPPTYLNHLVERHRQLFGSINRLEYRLRSSFPWAWLSDHYLMVFERMNNHDE